MSSVLYGLVGKTLKHSFSQRFFSEKIKRENIDARYENFELGSIAAVADLLRNASLRGFNVTIPYKEQILDYLDFVHAPIASLNAINTVKVIRKESDIFTYGFNTDVYGFYHSLKPLLKEYHRKALILGTGGAAKAVAFVLDYLGIEYLFVSRNKHKGLLYSKLDANVLREYLLIVNTTPLGMYPDVNKKPVFSYEYLSNKHLLYDLIYNPAETHFLREGKKNGALIKNGLEMLYLQAEKAWEIFYTGEIKKINLF